MADTDTEACAAINCDVEANASIKVQMDDESRSIRTCLGHAYAAHGVMQAYHRHDLSDVEMVVTFDSMFAWPQDKVTKDAPAGDDRNVPPVTDEAYRRSENG